MTVRAKFEDRLVQHGLWPDEAQAVMDEVEKDESNTAMRGRWSDEVSDYPAELFAVLWTCAKRVAITWLTQNKPKHFALALLGA